MQLYSPLKNTIYIGSLFFLAHYIVLASSDNLVPGETGGSPSLQRDTINQIFFFDRIEDKACKERRILYTEMIEPPDKGKFKHGRLFEGKWKERWSLYRCGKVVDYVIEYTADGKGGTYIGIQLPKSFGGKIKDKH